MIELSALRGRFGQRLLLLFVFLALVPICTLALITYRSVTRELSALREERLKNETKARTMAILERLALLDGELALLEAGTALESRTPIPEALEAPIAVRFERLTRFDAEDERSIHGAVVERSSLSIRQRVHLASGRALLVLDTGTSGLRALLVRASSQGTDGVPGELWSQIDVSYLWWGMFRENNLPPMTEVCIVQPALGLDLWCSSGRSARLPADLRARMREEALGQMTWSRGGEPHRAHYRTLDLSQLYGHPGFTVVLSEAESTLGGPLREFRRSFIPIVLATLWVVLLLSIRQIRRRLRPLELLRTGTRKIAERDFSTRVDVSSDDEFEELAGSFNRMAHRLGVQFDSLSALSDIQSALLSAHHRPAVAEVVLTKLKALLPCRAAQLTLLDPEEPQQITTYSWGAGRLDAPMKQLLSTEDLWWLQEGVRIRIVGLSGRLPSFLSSLRSGAVERVAVVPVVLGQKILGVVAAGLNEEIVLGSEDLGPIRQLADQIAQALLKAALIEELEELSLGTLSALARTIDANSKWTAGHSERVAGLAIRLGAAMGLSKRELDTLERGALLHDIGKLGVPSDILNKPSRLTAEEHRIVQRHVAIGAEILEPVPSLADTLPIVRQHHEWYDGCGYLEGLAGEEIHLLARVLAVVDCYDALRSARPYRRAVEEAEVLEHLRAMSSTQFDPAVVDAFLELQGASPGEPGVVRPRALRTLRD